MLVWLEVAAMRKLLSANLSRLWLNQAFWVSVIVMTMFEIIYCLLLQNQGPMPMDYVLFLSLQAIGVLASVFWSLFLGTEYSDGTIRNKLIVGHKRSDIYLANFFTGIIAVTIVSFAGVLTGGIFGAIAFAAPHYRIDQIALAGLIGWLASVAYMAIFNLVGMLSSSKAKTAIISILTAFLLIFIGLLVYTLASDSPSLVYQFFFDFNPFGQTAQAMTIVIRAPWRLAAYSLSLTLTLTALGLYLFSKKDLK